MPDRLAPRARELAPPWWSAAAAGLTPVTAVLLAAWAMHALLAPRVGPFYTKMLMDVGINVVLAVSLNLVNGFTGQFSLGHAGLMTVGGYTAGALTYYTSLRLWGAASDAAVPALAGTGLYLAALFAGGVAATAAGYLVGLPSIRLRGDYLAIVTLGFGEIVRVLLQRTEDVIVDPEAVRAAPLHELATHLGGALGFTGLPRYTNVFWVYAAVAAMLLAAYRLKASSQGRAMLAIRENEIAAAAVGVPVTRYKVRAFVIAAFFAGLAGGLYAHEIGTTLKAGELGFQRSVDIVIMVVLGGMGSISGAALAAVLLTALPQWLLAPTHVWHAGLAVVAALLAGRRGRPSRAVGVVAGLTLGFEALRWLSLRYRLPLGDYRMILYGLALVAVMVLRPQGIFGTRELWDYFPRRGRKGGRHAGPAAPAGGTDL